MSVLNVITDGAFGRIGKSTDPNLWNQFNAEAIHNQLRCTRNESHWLVMNYVFYYFMFQEL